MKSIPKLIKNRAELRKDKTKKRTPKTGLPDVTEKKENKIIKKLKKNQINSKFIQNIININKNLVIITLIV